MKIPSVIKIKKGVTYQVVWQDVVREDPDCMGHADGDAKIITLKSGMTEQDAWETLVHEILHIFTWEYVKIKIPHGLIYRLEKPILNVLTLNKWI